MASCKRYDSCLHKPLLCTSRFGSLDSSLGNRLENHCNDLGQEKRIPELWVPFDMFSSLHMIELYIIFMQVPGNVLTLPR